MTPLLLAKGCSAASALSSHHGVKVLALVPHLQLGHPARPECVGVVGDFLVETPPVSVALSGVTLTLMVGWDSGSVCPCLSPELLQNTVPCFPGEFMPL